MDTRKSHGDESHVLPCMQCTDMPANSHQHLANTYTTMVRPLCGGVREAGSSCRKHLLPAHVPRHTQCPLTLPFMPCLSHSILTCCAGCGPPCTGWNDRVGWVGLPA